MHPSIAILQTAALLLGYAASGISDSRLAIEDGWIQAPHAVRAGDEIRTRDPHLGKVVLYQLSYSRIVHGPNGNRTRVFTLKE